MKKPKKEKSRYRVHYTVTVNGTPYEKDAPFMASNDKDAESQLWETMKHFPETDYMINHTEIIS